MDEDRFELSDADAYRAAYHSTRAWGCLQKGWLMMKEELTEEMWASLRKLASYAEKLDIKLALSTALECEDTGEAEHIRLSALWCSLMDNWQDAGKGFGDLMLSIFRNLCTSHRIAESKQKTLLGVIEKELKKLGKTTVRAFTKAATGAPGSCEGIPSELASDMARTLNLMERAVFDAPKDPYEADIWYGPKIGWQERIKYLPERSPETDPESAAALPTVMVDLVTNETGFYQHFHQIWTNVLGCGNNLTGTAGRWFELGRDLALLIDQPAVPESILRKYFPDTFAEAPEAGFDPWYLPSEAGLEHDREQAREHVRNLPLKMPESKGKTAIKWAYSVHRQAEDVLYEQKPAEEEVKKEIKSAQQAEKPAEHEKKTSLTLNELAQKFLTYSRNNSAPKTADSYRSGLKYILKDTDEFRDKPAKELSPMDVEAVKRAMKGKGLSARSINKMVGAVKRVYNWAVDYKVLENNPVEGVEKVSSHVNAPDHAPQKHLSLDDAKKYIKLCADSPPLGDICRFLLHTGMRVGELVDLRWGDIDEESGFIRLQKHKTSSRTGKPRTIPIVKSALAIVENQKKERNQNGNTEPGDPVFVGDKGQKLKVDALQNRLKRLRKKHPQLENLTFHKLRHTCATLLAKNGVREQVAQQMLGHRSPLMTRYYTAVESDDLKEAAGRLSDGIEGV